MALNFGGMGFSFGATDDGAVKTSEGISNALGGVWTGLQKIGPAAAGAGRKLSGGLGRLGNAGRNAFGGISMAIASAVDSAQNPTLSTAYESMFAGFNKSFSSMTAGMDMTSKEASKMRRIIGSAAFGLNEDMDGAAKSWAAFRKQGVDIVKVMGAKGMKGAIQDLIRVTAVYGIEGEQLSLVMSGLIKGFDFTEDGVRGLYDSVAALGKMFNMGNEAIAATPAIFESLNQELADFGRRAKPKDIEKLTTSIVALGGGLKEALGMPAESALELARSVFTTVMGERKNIMNMFRGVDGEMGDFARQLTETGGSVEGMFQMIQGDPLKFMETLREMGKQAQATGGTTGIAFQRLNATINSTLGPNVAFAVQGNWDKVSDTMAKIPTTLQNAEGAFVDTAKTAHKTGLTTQEGWDRMMESMRSKLMKISGPVRKQWVKSMRKGFGSTIGIIQKMAGDEGPDGKPSAMSQFVQKLLLAKDVGVSAFFPMLGKMSTLFGGIATSMFPAMTALGSMGISFGKLGRMAFAGGGLFVLFQLLKNGPEEVLAGIKNMWSTLRAFVKEIAPGVDKVLGVVEEFFTTLSKGEGLTKAFKNLFANINWDSIKDSLVSGFKTVMGWVRQIPVGDILVGVKGLFEKVMGWIQKIDFQKIFGALSRAIASVPWGKVVSGAFSIVKGLAVGAVGLIKSFILGTDWKAVATAVGNALGSAIRGIADLVGSVLGSIFSPSKVQSETEGPLRAGMMGAFSAVISAIIDAASGFVKGLFNQLWGYLFDADSVGDALGRIVKVVGIGFVALLIASKKFRGKVTKTMKSTFAKIRTEFQMTKSKGKALFRTLRVGAKTAMKGMRTGLRAFGGIGLIMGLVEAMDQVKIRMENISLISNSKLIPDFQKAQLEGEQAFRGIGETIDSVFMGLPSMVGNALDISGNDLSNFYHDMVGGFEKAITITAEGFGNFVTLLSDSWDVMVSNLNYGWEKFVGYSEEVVLRVKTGWRSIIRSIEGLVDGMASSIKMGFMTMRHSLELVLGKTVAWLADKITQLPDIIKKTMPAMAKWAEKAKKSWEATGGEAGQKRRQAKELESFRTAQQRRDKMRAEEAREDTSKLSSLRQENQARNRKNAEKSVKLANKLFVNQLKGLKRTGEMLDEVDKSTAETKATSKRVQEDLDEMQKNKEKGKDAALGGLGGGKGKGKGRGAKLPTGAQLGAATGSRVVLDPGVRGEIAALVGNTGTLVQTMNQFYEKPFELKLQLDAKSGLRNLLKVGSSMQGRGAA